MLELAEPELVELAEKLVLIAGKPIYLDGATRVLLQLDGLSTRAARFSDSEWTVFLSLLMSYPLYVPYMCLEPPEGDRQRLRDLIYQLRSKVKDFGLAIPSLRKEGYCLIKKEG